MTEPTLEDSVREALADVLAEPAERFQQEPVLAAHQGWDSVTSLEALAQLESIFGVVLDLRAYQAARTVEDLVGLLRGARGGAAAAQS